MSIVDDAAYAGDVKDDGSVLEDLPEVTDPADVPDDEVDHA